MSYFYFLSEDVNTPVLLDTASPVIAIYTKYYHRMWQPNSKSHTHPCRVFYKLVGVAAVAGAGRVAANWCSLQNPVMMRAAKALQKCAVL